MEERQLNLNKFKYKTVSQKQHETTIKCPFCPCQFSTTHDFMKHLQTFTLQPTLHHSDFKKVHRYAETEVERKHGRADKTIRTLAKILKPKELWNHETTKPTTR